MAGLAGRIFLCRSFASSLRPLSRSVSYNCKKLEFNRFGDPNEVITLTEEKIDDNVSGSEVLVRMLAAPLNPADINTVQGTYPAEATPQQLPAVVGSEGLGEVIAMGPRAKNMVPGDWVIPFCGQLGTCRSHLRAVDDDLIQIRREVPLLEAATMAVNPCTAYRLLHDFAYIGENDLIIQNAANSAVGRAVIQLCHRLGIRTVNIVRDRDNLDELIKDLTSLGASIVLTDEQLRTTRMFDREEDRPVLALDAVGGRSSADLCRCLLRGSPLVVYGAMSRAPPTVPASRLIFSDIQVRGFWMTRWNRQNSTSMSRLEMLDQIQSMCINGRMRVPPHRCVLIDDYKEAISKTLRPGGKVEEKQIIVFDENLVTRDQ